jgi:hypothetical protein
VSDVTENHSLNVINVKQYPVSDEQLSLSTKFREVMDMVLESDHLPQKLRI